MKQVFTCRPAGGHTIFTNYTSPFSDWGSGAGWVFVESAMRPVWPSTGVMRNLGIQRWVPPGPGESVTVTLRKNGVDTALVCNLTGTNASMVATGVDISVVPGDLLVLKYVTSSNPAALTLPENFSIEFEGSVPRESAYSIATTGGINTIPWYSGIFRSASNWNATDTLTQRNVVAVPGVLTGFRADLTTAPGSGNTLTFTIRLNGVDQDGTSGTPDTRLFIAGSATAGATIFSLRLAPGDQVAVKAIMSAGSVTEIGIACTFRADTDGYSQYCGHGSGLINTSVPAFSTPVGSPHDPWATTETDVQMSHCGATPFQLLGLIVATGSAPDPGNSVVFDGRINNASPSGGPVATVANTAQITTSSGGPMLVSPDDVFSLRATPFGTPTPGEGNWAWGQFIATSVGARVTQLVALLVQDRDPDPAVTTPPTGGGTVGAGIDPPPGIDLCPVEVPVAFMDITPPGLSTRRYSAVPINVTVADDPRVASFGSVTRALVKGGDIRGSSASAELIDTDRFLRGLEAADGLPNSVVEYYISSEAGIKAGATPRRVFSGLITDSEPLAGLKFRIQATDYLQALLDQKPLPTYPQRVFSVADFPNLANDPKSTTSPGNPSLIGKPIPIGYGLLSDEHLGLAARGVVPAFFVGKRLVDGFDWDEYVLFAHAPSPGGILGFFGDVFGGVSRDRFDTSFEGVDFLWPGHAGWNASVGPALYRDFNGNRYTVFYARGPRSDSAREMRIPFSVNIGGVEAVGDGTGLLIESLPLQVLHLLINFVLQNYTSGAWLAPPLVNGYSRVKTSSFTTIKTRSEVRTGTGWIGAFLLGWNLSSVTLRDIARMAEEHGIQLGTNKDGQIIGSTYDPLAASVRSVTDITDTIEKSFQARRQRAEIRSRVLYRHERRYVPALPEPTPVTGEAMPNELRQSHVDWEVDNEVITDAGSIASYGTRTMDLSLELTRDEDTADDLAALHLDVLAPGPVVARYREGLCGTNIDLGDNHELTHFEGITSAGWTDQLLRCEQHRLDLDRFEVEVDSLDVSGLTGSP